MAFSNLTTILESIDTYTKKVSYLLKLKVYLFGGKKYLAKAKNYKNDGLLELFE